MTSMRQVLATYRFTPHATTGVSPSSLMLAFTARTPLTVLTQSTTSRPTVVDNPAVRKRVEVKQAEMTRRHDERVHAKASTIKPGDEVRIRLPRQSHKLANRYSEPRKVVQSSRHTVWLENGQRWNVRRCLLHRSSVSATQSTDSSRVTADPSPAQSGTDSDEEGPTFSFAVRPPTLLNGPSGQSSASPRPPGPRRSSRVRKQRDFGPVVRH
jgi:hypothetical protein